jgi:cytochrome c-type biogenesis protein CcmH
LAQAEVRHEEPSEARVRAIAQGLRCAVCQNQSIYESNADLAKDMVRIVREKVAQGLPDADIQAYFHDRYGDYIYMEPPRHGGNWLLWIGPFVGLALGGVGLAMILRRWRTSQHGHDASESLQPPPGPADPEREALQARIQSEMDKMKL